MNNSNIDDSSGGGRKSKPSKKPRKKRNKNRDLVPDSSLYANKRQDDGVYYRHVGENEIPQFVEAKATNLYAFDKELHALMSRRTFRIPTVKRGIANLESVDASKPLGRLWKMMSTALAGYVGGYVYSPCVEACYWLAHEPDFGFLSGGALTERGVVWEYQSKEGLEICEKFLKMLAATYATKEFAAILKSRRDSAREALKSMRFGITSVMNDNAFVKIVRVDFHFHDRNAIDEDGRIRVDDFTGGALVEKLWREKARYVKNMGHNALFTNVLWWVLKVEYGETCGPHIHAIFVYPHSEGRSASTLARLLGEHWTRHVGGNGSYHNCHFDVNKYKHCCIGTVHRNDLKAMLGLEKALTYLAKEEQYFRVRGFPGGKSFTQKLIAGSKRIGGRRRSDPNLPRVDDNIGESAEIVSGKKYPLVTKIPATYSAKSVRASRINRKDADPQLLGEVFLHNEEMSRMEEAFARERHAWLVQETSRRKDRRKKMVERKAKRDSELLRPLKGSLIAAAGRSGLRSAAEKALKVEVRRSGRRVSLGYNLGQEDESTKKAAGN